MYVYVYIHIYIYIYIYIYVYIYIYICFLGGVIPFLFIYGSPIVFLILYVLAFHIYMCSHLFVWLLILFLFVFTGLIL